MYMLAKNTAFSKFKPPSDSTTNVMTGGQGVKVSMIGATGGLVSQMKHSAFKFYGNEVPAPN